MRCPGCDKELVVVGQERLETLDEHIMCVREVSLKDRYVCQNSDCQLKPEEYCWNEYGDFYHTPQGNKFYRPDPCLFIDGLKCARGTHARKLEREIDGTKEERKKITKGRWQGWTKIWETHYTSDQDGNILSSRKAVRWVTPEGIYYMSPWKMIRYSMGRMYQARKRNNYREELLRVVKRSEWPNPENWRKITGVIAKLLLKYDPKARIK